MRKNQNGVSMISLVITIIVMIILAAVAFGSSTETITNATFADFQNDITEVQQFVDTKVTSVYGNLKAEGSNVNYQQVRNYVAKGATLLEGESGENAWLPMSVSTKLAATHILPETAKAVFENELPGMTVNTANATKVPVSYFLTKSGKVFIWPPYLNESEGVYYMNKEDIVTLYVKSGDGYAPSGDPVNSANDTDVLAMFTGTIYTKVGDDLVAIQNNKSEALKASEMVDTLAIENTNLATAPVVYYNDVPRATAPYGLESSASMYDSEVDANVKTTY
ncbi:MAG: hypothetical protein IJX99_08860 [Clostridia bacterium]|nr:hypothetical protein [Clostridia bacterium]